MKRIRLTLKECQVIEQIMSEREISRADLGKVIGCDSPQMSRKFGRQVSFSYNEIKKIYVTLGNDERLKFLEIPKFPKN